jgi:hypothetical protein
MCLPELLELISRIVELTLPIVQPPLRTIHPCIVSVPAICFGEVALGGDVFDHEQAEDGTGQYGRRELEFVAVHSHETSLSPGSQDNRKSGRIH